MVMVGERWLREATIRPQVRLLGLVGLGVWLAISAFFGPVYALIPLGVILGLLVLVNPTVRIAFVVFGGLISLQSSQELGALKIAYLAGVFIALAAALLSLQRQVSEREGGDAWIQSSILIFTLIGISLLVSLSRGTGFIAWLRDAAPYMLLGSVPILAADASGEVPRRTLVSMFVLAGTLSAISFGLAWAGPFRRHLVDLPLDRLIYPNGGLPGALFAFAISRAFSASKRSLYWLFLASFIFAMLLVTGTRTALLFLVIPLVFLMSRRLQAGRLRRLVVLAAAGLVVALTTVYLVRVSSADANALLGRFGSFGQLVSDPTSDLSVQDRLAQTAAAWNAFVSAPILGVGPGHEFTWTGYAATPTSSFAIDTSFSFPAKFGLLGVVFLILIASLLWRSTRTARARRPELALVLSSYFTLQLCYLIFGNPLEEKGFGLALLFLIALLLRESSPIGKIQAARVQGRKSSMEVAP